MFQPSTVVRRSDQAEIAAERAADECFLAATWEGGPHNVGLTSVRWETHIKRYECDRPQQAQEYSRSREGYHGDLVEQMFCLLTTNKRREVYIL